MSENIVLEMTIEPPPKTSLNSTTTMGGGAAMEIGDLKTAMADLSNGFQNGSIGGALGMNVTTMAMQVAHWSCLDVPRLCPQHGHPYGLGLGSGPPV